jgi:hypothetical protein
MSQQAKTLLRKLTEVARERKHCLNVLRECEAALEARGSYSPVRLARLIKRLEVPITL